MRLSWLLVLILTAVLLYILQQNPPGERDGSSSPIERCAFATATTKFHCDSEADGDGG